MHLKPLVGSPRPVGEAIVRHLFPPGESGRVPLVAVSGSNGKTLVASLVASMLTAASHTVGEASSRGLRIGQRVLSSKDCADAASARRVLVNPFVDAIVVEADARKVMQEGLAFDRCDVAVVTNLDSVGHAHEPDEKERALLAKAIRAPVDVVLPEGYAVLNAEEPEVTTMAVKCRGKIVYFARDAEAALMREHLDKGGQLVSLEKGTIVARQMAQLVPILEIDQLRSPPPLASLLAAVGVGVALGLTPHAVREGIATALQLQSSAC
jgi:cyanophycin synthetase